LSPSSPSKTEQVLSLIRNSGVVRPKDLEAHGIHREYLRRLEQQGSLVRTGRGLYTLANADISEHYSLAEASKRVPHGVICLLSALRFHGLTTQAPFEVWIAIHRKARTPKEPMLPLHVVYMSGQAFQAGIETHQVVGVTVPVFCPAKTVADCFKYRHKIGLDVALEALQECWTERRVTMDELWHYAKICRMSQVMRPYLEALV
jgi:predicted transcriptional regulator of viral defense system